MHSALFSSQKSIFVLKLKEKVFYFIIRCKISSLQLQQLHINCNLLIYNTTPYQQHTTNQPTIQPVIHPYKEKTSNFLVLTVCLPACLTGVDSLILCCPLPCFLAIAKKYHWTTTCCCSLIPCHHHQRTIKSFPITVSTDCFCCSWRCCWWQTNK